jgi:hypothetical protein
MFDNARKWQAEPDWQQARIVGRSVKISSRTGLHQRFVSGNIERFLGTYNLGRDVGALSIALGDRYAVRMARDRLLVVGISVSELADGWHDEGFAVSTASSALRLIEVEGRGIVDLLRRTTSIDPDNPGPCAAISFCDVSAVVYRHAGPQLLRIHLDRGYAAYVWDWLECHPLFLGDGMRVEDA